MGRALSLAFVVTLAVVCAAIEPMSVCAQADAAADSTPPGASYTFENTAAYFNTDRANFLPGASHWGEGFTRGRWHYLLPSGLHSTAGGVLLTTVGTDYCGVADQNDGLFDQLSTPHPTSAVPGWGSPSADRTSSSATAS